MSKTILLTLLLHCSLVGASVHAQTYPSKPIHVIVPYATGGAADGLMRPIGSRMSELLGQPVIIENKAGANGTVGADLVAKSKPDGYTILMGAIGPNSVAGLMQALPYDPRKDFAPVALLASVSNVLVVNATSSIKSLKDLIEQAKTRPGVLTYGSTGNGSSNQLAAELLKLAANINLIEVPYKGGVPMQTDLMGGYINILFDNLPAALPQIRGGKFLPLAVTSLKRQPDLPNVPTMDELGFSKFETGAWYGLFLPAKTPAHIVEQLNAVTNKILNEPTLQARFRTQGFDLSLKSANEFGEFVAAETSKWKTVIDKAGIKAQ
jgi:tripartite-type tricarboxylate transporter receptor subunit TctC